MEINRTKILEEQLKTKDELGISGGCLIIFRNGGAVSTDLFEELNDVGLRPESD